MKVQTHIKIGEFAAVGAAQTRGNGHAAAGILDGGTLSPDELFQSLRREVRPWFAFPSDRSRGLTAGKQEESTSRSFVMADRAMQEFTLRWIDPLFGERADHHLQDMGLALN